MRRLACLLAAPALLAGCSSGNDQGTSISFNTGDSDGNIVADGGGGHASFKIPGLSGTIKLPKMEMTANQVDLNGVHLYPGSTVTGFNVAANSSDNDDDDKGTITIRFDSPAAPATVRDWFQGKLTAASFSVHPDGDGLAGKTEDGKPFRLDLTPDGTGKAHGTIVSG